MEAMREAWTDRKLDRLEGRMEARFEQVDLRFEQIDRRFAEVDHRFARIEALLGSLDRRVDKLNENFIALQHSLNRGSWGIIATLVGIFLSSRLF